MKRIHLRTMLGVGLVALLVTACGGTGGPPAPTGASATPAPTAVNFPEQDITLINPFAGGNF
ncbi:MAG TPA: hypothetical protein VJP45_14185, partial [Candidatus Limnocylindria bacterium]|nr:hypothetical protein [Candidatus Limnocylindria bacterium]